MDIEPCLWTPFPIAPKTTPLVISVRAQSTRYAVYSQAICVIFRERGGHDLRRAAHPGTMIVTVGLVAGSQIVSVLPSK